MEFLSNLGQTAMQGAGTAATAVGNTAQGLWQGATGATPQGTMGELGRAGLTPQQAQQLGVQVLGPQQAAPMTGAGMQLGQGLYGMGNGLMGNAMQGATGAQHWGNLLGQLLGQSQQIGQSPQALGQWMGGIQNHPAAAPAPDAKALSDKANSDTLNTILAIATLFLGG